jgi:hypothetical protein
MGTALEDLMLLDGALAPAGHHSVAQHDPGHPTRAAVGSDEKPRPEPFPN